LTGLEHEHARLKREADGAGRLLDVVQERAAKLSLERLLHRDLRLLDGCAPAPCR